MEAFSKFIVFRVNEQEYAADIQQVVSIEKVQEVVQLPQTPDFIKGVINLRGSITPILDLKQRLGMQEATYTDQTRILIASMENVQVGLVVDVATDVLDIDNSVVEPAPDMVGGVSSKYLKGVAKLENRLLLLLDLERVLSFEELHEVQQVAQED
ncbi:chemotaxis protein CheW [Radiobacillus deserti]|uniref:Purine-binding chemotaxis protein CheW n=1 Tax=Radiobacillus deserti TaxID=2594883 RepID=A0A516KI24_9BACI|nr:chemotaxis protein CheW [Radiobacillus deserti]QDP41031.1 purine-binding chemotaxis protein CheW [Radiobacillus deserti]